MKTTENRGSALLLVIIGLLILSLIGLAALTQSGSEINTAGNFYKDKSGFYAADAGIQFGIRRIQLSTTNPKSVFFEGTIGDKSNKYSYRTGRMSDLLPTAKNVKGFQGFPIPQQVGNSMEMGSEPNMQLVPWELVITAEGNAATKNRIRKQVQTVVITMVPRDY